MSKNGNLKSIVSSDSKKDSINEHIKNNKNDLKNKLSDKFMKINDYSLSTNSGKVISEFSNFIGFNHSNSKNINEKSSNNSKQKYNKNKIITIEETNENENNIKDDNLSRHQHFKNLSNTDEKEIYSLNNNINYDTKFKKNISNFNTHKSELTNINPFRKSEIVKSKNINTNKNTHKNNNLYKNNNYGKNIYKYRKKISNNNDNKIDKLISFMNSNNKNKNVIHNINNYMNTNPNNQNKNISNKNINNYNSDIKCNISINKKYEKSCPKLNFNKNKSYMQTKLNSNYKQLNYEQINEDNNV
jgi:hypothetical protein